MEVQSTEPKCSLCEAIVDDYCPEFVEQMKKNYGDFKDFQVFFNNFKKDPDSVRDQCITCRKSKWQIMKYTNNRQVRPPHTNTANAPKKKLLVIITSLIVGIIGYQISEYFNTSSTNNLSDDNLKSIMGSLKSKFPSLQQSILNKLGGALLRLNKPGEPIVFMLLHDDTNKKTTDCLVSYASNTVKKLIFTNSQKSLWMNGSEWTSYTDFDHEDLLYKKLTTPLEENNVLVLENLQDLPWSLAKMLHHLCDAENPTFTEAMYMLELKVKDDLQQLSEREKILVAERAMNMIWQDAPNEFRAPLIARLTSYVDAVLWESDQPCHRESFIRISP